MSLPTSPAAPNSPRALSGARAGHLAAIVTIFIWGTTFISTKTLLNSFSPVQILFARFVIGYFMLWLAAPRRLVLRERKEELLFASAGLCGVTLYFLFENIALTYTLASNVGVIISVAPFFTALADWLLLKGQRPKPRFLLGFLLALGGIFLISFNGSQDLELNPIGDLLALLAAVVWALYSTLTKKLGSLNYPTIETTRRGFFYGLILMIPALFFLEFDLDYRALALPVNLLNLLYLGMGASAFCFASWGLAVKVLGSVKTSVYIYLVPVVTVITSALILGERLTPPAAFGAFLTLAGLVISEGRLGTRPAKTAKPAKAANAGKAK